MENLFKYKVIGLDCNGAGEAEEWTEYEGFDRAAAIEAKHTCEEKSIAGYIRILTPGPNGWHNARQEKEYAEMKAIEQEAEETYWIAYCNTHHQNETLNIVTLTEELPDMSFEEFDDCCEWQYEII